MKSKKLLNYLPLVVRWLLLAVTIVFIISGLGITEFRTVESFTFGLLDKTLAFKIHIKLWIPFLIMLILHVCMKYVFRYMKSRINENTKEVG